MEYNFQSRYNRIRAVIMCITDHKIVDKTESTDSGNDDVIKDVTHVSPSSHRLQLPLQYVGVVQRVILARICWILILNWS